MNQDADTPIVKPFVTSTVPESSLYNLLKISPMPVTISTLAEGRFIEVNEQFCELTGYSREEVIGHTVRELNFWGEPDQRDYVLRTLREVGVLRNLEASYYSKS